MVVDDCKQCKFPCSRRDWYSWGQIRFCRPQMVWLITHIKELGEGNWPDSPDGSSYVDPSLRSKSFRDEGYFVKPSGIVAGIKGRLQKTKQDGQTLMEEIHSGLREYSLLSQAARNALNYISIFDWRKRRQTYSEWKADVKRRAKNHKYVVKG